MSAASTLKYTLGKGNSYTRNQNLISSKWVYYRGFINYRCLQLWGIWFVMTQILRNVNMNIEKLYVLPWIQCISFVNWSTTCDVAKSTFDMLVSVLCIDPWRSGKFLSKSIMVMWILLASSAVIFVDCCWF